MKWFIRKKETNKCNKNGIHYNKKLRELREEMILIKLKYETNEFNET